MALCLHHCLQNSPRPYFPGMNQLVFGIVLTSAGQISERPSDQRNRRNYIESDGKYKANTHRLHKFKLLSLLHLLDLEDVLQRSVIENLPVLTHLRIRLHQTQPQNTRLLYTPPNTCGRNLFRNGFAGSPHADATPSSWRTS